MFPHVADIIVNHFAMIDTKLIVILRDPVYRFISGFFEQFGHSFNNENHAIIQWLYQNVNDGINVIGIRNEFDSGTPNITLALETKKFINKLETILASNPPDSRSLND